MKNFHATLFLLITFLINSSFSAIAQNADSTVLNYNMILGYALNGNIPEILNILDTIKLISGKEKKIKSMFENRFKYASDKTNYFLRSDTSLNPLNRVFQDYWRKSMLDNKTNYDKYFGKKLISFLISENHKMKFTNRKISRRTVYKDLYLEYIRSKELMRRISEKPGIYMISSYGKVKQIQRIPSC